MTLSRRASRAAGAGCWRIDAGRLHLDATARRLLGESRPRQSLARWLARQPASVAAALTLASQRQAQTPTPSPTLSITLTSPAGTLLMRGNACEGLLLPLPETPPPGPDLALAHELRTPLDAIVGFSRIARAELGAAPAARWLASIESASQLLLRAVGDLLDQVRPDPEAPPGDARQPLDLHALVTRLGEIGAGLRPDGAVALYAHVDPRCPVALRGDAARLEQVLLNLLANALKYTARGRVVLAVKAAKPEGGKVRLRLSVADTGAGMPLQALPRVGRPFERLHGALGTQAPRAGGSGLGLALVQRVLALQGSTLKLASVDGGGTTCWFEMAFELAEADATPAPAATAPPVWAVHSHDRLFSASVATQWRAQGQALCAAGSDARRWVVDCTTPGATAFAAQRRARGDQVQLASAAPREGACTLALLAATLLGTAAPPLAEAVPPLAGLRVLLLEDNATNQFVTADLLQRAGAQVVVTDRAAAALARVEREHFDFALLDLQLPDGTGLDVARALRASPAGATLPFAMLSAGLSTAARREAESLGALACLVKPVPAAALTALLQRVQRAPSPLQRLFARQWPAQRALITAGADAAALQGPVHALRGSLAVLGDAAALALARRVEEGLLAGRPPATLPLADLLASADSLAALGQ